MKQVIVYEAATGHLRRVLDPERECSDAELIALANAQPDESTSLYLKKGKGPDGKGLDHAHSWQTHVNSITGKDIVFGAVTP